MNVSVGVKELVTRRVKDMGPISFAEYMELVLYSDPSGYYRRHVPGRGADYRTSPTLSSGFGNLVCRQIEQLWDALGQPETFRVAEAGGASGVLALSVLRSAPPALAGALEWVFVEPLIQIEKLQREAMAAGGDSLRTQWVGDLREVEPGEGLVLANEVLDNMPFRILEISSSGEFSEIRVDLSGERLVEVATPIRKDSKLAAGVSRAFDYLEPGDRLEVRPAAAEWCRCAASALNRGYLLVIDYGDPEPEIWAHHPAGTVVTYRDEQLGFDPFTFVGEADITAHVNFSELSRAARHSGFTPLPLLTQRGWLRSLGLGDIEQELRREQRLAEERGDHAGALRFLAERSRVSSLGSRGGLGNFKVLLAKKGIAP